MKKHFFRCSIASITVSIAVLIVLSTGYLFLNTQEGLILTSQFAQRWLPGKLSVGELKGCLLGPIEIQDLNYTGPRTKLSISSAQWDWHWSDLLKGYLNIGSLFINTLSLSIEKKDNNGFRKKNNTEKFQVPWLLKHIQLRSADVRKIIIYYGDNQLTFSGLLHKQWQCHWQLTIPKIEQFISDGRGCIVLNGKITGEQFSPEFYFLLSTTDLIWKDWQLKRVQCACHLNSVKNKRLSLDLTARQLGNKMLIVKPIHINFSGVLRPLFLEGNLSGFKLIRRTDMKQEKSLGIPANKIRVQLNSSGLEASVITDPASTAQLNATIQLPHYYRAHAWINRRQTVKGNIQLSLKNINYLESFIPRVKNLQGFLSTQFIFYGPIVSPLMDITLHLKKGSAQIPSLGLDLKNINVSFHTEKQQLKGSGQLNSGRGSLLFQSQTQLNHPYFLSSIDLKGKDLDISHTREYKITASPALRIEADSHHIAVTGLIVFPNADITINTGNPDLVELSSDIVFLGHEQQAVSLPFTYANNVKLQLGKDVQFTYRGLSSRATGALTMNQTTGHPILATGELVLKGGSYTYYGQSLTLRSDSSLSFTNSPIDNPNLDIYADRRVWVLPKTNHPADALNSTIGSPGFISTALQTTQTIRATVGVHLQGYVANPQITLYVDPASAIDSQLDILAYLITGQPSSQLSAGSLQLLLGAATHLGGKQSGFTQLISSAQKKIGIDQLTIGSNPIFNPNTNSFQQNTSIIVGKNLSPRLNISYSLGLLDPISVLQVNYLLNKYFSLTSTSSNFGNGIDLLYKIEKK